MSEKQSALERFNTYEAVIGIEVHVQLATNTKIFCACPNNPNAEPNSTICPICTGYPGVLPVLNEKVIEYAIMAGIGTHSTITSHTEFDRKHYFYPDLPKGYQITQQRLPICTDGHVSIRLENGSVKKIRLIRIHIEEDAGKSTHAGTESFVDLNRAGTPLLEIVSQPDIANAFEARAYLKALRALVQHLGICSGNMEEGAFRADTNISVRKKGQSTFGTRVELKNINSFKFISDAIEYEIERQITAIEAGHKIRQETRLWDTKEHETVVMRSKEEAADYRYMQEPDLPAITISAARITDIQAALPRLPFELFDYFCAHFGLTPYEAEIIVEDPQLAAYTQEALTIHPSKGTVHWILRDIMELIKNEKISIAQCRITPRHLAELMKLLEAGAINNQGAKQIFTVIAQTGKHADALVKELGLEQMGSSDELESIVDAILAQSSAEVARYKGGEQKLFGFFVGEAMKATKGKGNPKLLTELFKKKLQ
ncbi:MAG: Asp-tRNA(Asn)/Glu-tRNA(Gln) amidotransferase subunit GatB [Candidatus Babeliales bacterium]